jgi:hypothetical protein
MSTIGRPVGESMSFSGGAEETPTVRVVKYFCPGSLHHGEKTLVISQEGESIVLSPGTMQAILEWYYDAG